jgi:hypothetical protein
LVGVLAFSSFSPLNFLSPDICLHIFQAVKGEGWDVMAVSGIIGNDEKGMHTTVS